MEKIKEIAATFSELQGQICRVLEAADGKGSFGKTAWKKDIGGGVTRVIENGRIIEKGAVNFSFVQGDFSEKMESILGEKAGKYAATGISSILHAENPWVPTIHMNVRYFALDNGVSWFGGGIDLTPSIIVPKEAQRFHQHLKEICDSFHPDFYPDFKKWADDYYYLPHRDETRGVGGIFFDRLKPDDKYPFDVLLGFVAAQAAAYPEIYAELMKNHEKQYSEREKEWQNLRRGRYVEFNLLNDRGTKFGLESNGNTESILVSMPANASWKYNYEPEIGSFEANTLNRLKKGINWIDNID
ncbi:oxygen-dependent coproporphyrinogen oxidase [Maribellus sediminis]|uniref:oxygen-dependent coproporphyrinogen oxidase n=1 Tax=Maribellus sediminis TaxID=2696285 RepID=UPI001F103CE8|nr:oxygen-dependent coproporphyrinogen oxidase [Maribellus sediminis]